MLGSTALPVERRNQRFQSLHFAEFPTALVGRGVLTESNPNVATVSLAGNSRPYVEAPFHNPNMPRRQNQDSVTLAPRGGERNPLERSHANDTQKSKTL